MNVFEIKEKIINAIYEAVKEHGVSIDQINLEHPEVESFGDYSCNVAMKIASQKAKGDFLKNILWFYKNINNKNFREREIALPIGKLNKQIGENFGIKERKVWLRGITFAKIRGWRKKEGFDGHGEINESFFWSIPYVLFHPQHIIKSQEKNRYLFVGELDEKFSLVVEIGVLEKKNWLVSAFISRERFLKKHEKDCLEHKKNGMPAGTAVSPILASKSMTIQSGGSRFSTLQDTKSFYSKLETDCQEKILEYEEKKNPMEIAQKIVDFLQLRITNYELRIIEKIEVKNPGFINFWIKKEVFLDVIQNNYEFPKTGKKVMVEFTDPNPFKEFHIGHLYSNTIGECVSRLNEAIGNDVRRACYQGDVGMHVAKSVYGLISKFDPAFCGTKFEIDDKNINKKLSELGEKTIEEKQKFLGEAYAMGATAFEESEDAKKEIAQLNKKIYEKDASIIDLYEKGRAWSLEYFEKIYDRLGMKKKKDNKHFDYYYFEGDVSKFGLEFVKDNMKNGVFKTSDGAVIFPGEDHGLHNRVFINSLGLPTYEAKELGLAPSKFKDFAYDKSIIVTGNEINEYFKVLLKVLSLINPDLAAKTTHIGHGMVKLPAGKMSSRTGNVITGEWLLDEAKEKVKTQYQSDDELAEKIGVVSVKYALLKSGVGRDVVFDFEKSVAMDGNSGPYLQYTFVRTRSILTKIPKSKSPARNSLGESVAGGQIPNKFQIQNTKQFNNLTIQQYNDEELNLIRCLYKFPEVVQASALNYSPNLLCNFLYDLAQKFNLFYTKNRIIDKEEINEFRLFLTEKTGEVLKKGMEILNLPIVEKM